MDLINERYLILVGIVLKTGLFCIFKVIKLCYFIVLQVRNVIKFLVSLGLLLDKLCFFWYACMYYLSWYAFLIAVVC